MAKPKTVEVPGVEESGRPQDTETAQAPVNVPERKPDESGKVYTPKVTATSRGKISSTLEGIANEFKRLYPDQQVRWVFHSARKPELSNVISRMAEGYSRIEPKEFKGYPVDPFIDEKGDIRVADVILMKIPAGQRQANAKERQRMADQQLHQVSDAAKHSMDGVREGRHGVTARGGIKMEERDHDLNYTQPDSKE